MPFQTPPPTTPPLEESPAGGNQTSSSSAAETDSKKTDWLGLLWPDPQPEPPPVLTRTEVKQMLQQVLETVRMLPPSEVVSSPSTDAGRPTPKVAADSAVLSVSFAFHVAEGPVFDHHIDIPFPGFKLETMWPVNLRSVSSALHGAVNVPVHGAITEYIEQMRENCGRPERPLKLTPSQDADNRDDRNALEMQ